MARQKRRTALDAPRDRGGKLGRTAHPSRDRFGKFSEAFARAMGTSGFLIGMTVFVVVWLTWNSTAPVEWQFDPVATNFTLLTLILSLQASYAAPLILLAQRSSRCAWRCANRPTRSSPERCFAPNSRVC